MGGKPLSVWRDIVADYLEIKGLFKASERGPLLNILERKGLRAKQIRTPCCFSVGSCAVIADRGKITSILIYNPAGKGRPLTHVKIA